MNNAILLFGNLFLCLFYLITLFDGCFTLRYHFNVAEIKHGGVLPKKHH